MKASKDLKEAISAVWRREARQEVSECLDQVILKVEQKAFQDKLRAQFEAQLAQERREFENWIRLERQELEEEHTRKEVQMIQRIQATERDCSEWKEKCSIQSQEFTD